MAERSRHVVVFEAARAIQDAIRTQIAGLTDQERVDVAELVYVGFAEASRLRAADVGEFQVEQTRQLAQVEALARRIREDEPDLEAQRLAHEGDREGLLNHIARKLRQ